MDVIFNTFKSNTVIHFAGVKAVGESVADQMKYFDLNICGYVSLLSSMSKAGFKYIIFSLSVTDYGKPQYLLYDKKYSINPVNLHE
jgi:UDP-glucose 4-epimerase